MKHNGLTHYELAQLVLKCLTLLSATVSIVREGGDLNEGVEQMVICENERGSSGSGGRVEIRYEDMGGVIGGEFEEDEEEEEEECLLVMLKDGRRVIKDVVVVGQRHDDGNIDNSTANGGGGEEEEKDLDARLKQLEEELTRPFALPHPARQALLSVVLLVLSKKGVWRSVSNAALFPTNDDSTDNTPNNNNNNKRWMLLLNWQAFLTMLLRTSPYLDEHKSGSPPMEASSMRSKILKSTVSLIRSCRCFFDQGIRPPGWKSSGGDNDNEKSTGGVELDATARALWRMTQNDLLYHSHSISCFRALIILYLFHPSKCSSGYYLEVMPKWMESWRNVDRCPEYDYLWMVLFGRARKFVHSRDQDWGDLRRLLLTQCGYW